jgi:hypothetical protein
MPFAVLYVFFMVEKEHFFPPDVNIELVSERKQQE